MRLIPRYRHNQPKPPRISISQAEITADLIYPANSRAPRTGAARRDRGGDR
jgi:hypothetical protein